VTGAWYPVIRTLAIKHLTLNQRFYSLDVFRGATVCLMILVNNPGSWSSIYGPLEHASWHGLTPTDLVFPFFLFAVGNALAFVMPKLEAGGAGMFWRRVIKRTVIIFLVGLFLTWWPFVKWEDGHLVFRAWVDPKNPESGIRILGVLQRIAICYFFAAIIIYYLKFRGAFLTGLILLLLYWALCFLRGDPNDPYSMTGYFGNEIDRKLLGTAHLYKGEGVPFDPEGIMSTIPSIVEVLFGYLVGDYIQKRARLNDPAMEGKNYEMLSGLFVIGIALLVTGFCWDTVFPINKKIWTSSYVVYTTGLAIMTIGTMIYLIEFKKLRGWLSRFFDVFGKNALFVFALSAFLPRGLSLIRLGDGTNPWNWLYKKVLIHIPGAKENGSLAYAICIIILMWGICWWMDRKRIYIKV
jgi:predicted acyltransferase